MGFLKNLFTGASAQSSGGFHLFHVKCDRCGETIEGRVNMANDLSLEDGGEGYFVRKVLMGSGHCFQKIEVELRSSAARKLLEKSAHGGTFIE